MLIVYRPELKPGVIGIIPFGIFFSNKETVSAVPYASCWTFRDTLFCSDKILPD